jgi:hypothetical protein
MVMSMDAKALRKKLKNGTAFGWLLDRNCNRKQTEVIFSAPPTPPKKNPKQFSETLAMTIDQMKSFLSIYFCRTPTICVTD